MSIVVVDEEGNEVEDPVSFLPIPVRYDIVVDAKHYDVRTLARAVHYGHPYVPHTRRVFSSEEMDRIIADSVYARPPSRCGSYRRKRGSYQDLYDLAVAAAEDDDSPWWDPARAWSLFVEKDPAGAVDAGRTVLDVLIRPDFSDDPIVEETRDSINWFIVKKSKKRRVAPSDRRTHLAVVRTNYDVVMDALLRWGYERSWTS